MNKKKFGEYVRAKRYEQGISVAKVAEKTKISEVQLRNIENGVHAPRPETFFKIITALGLDSREAIMMLEDERRDNE